MRTLIRPAVLLALALVVATASVVPASAAPGPRIGLWQRIANPGPAGLQTDGSRYAVPEAVPTDGSRYAVTHTDDASITVHDSATNRDRTLPFPVCRFPDGTPDRTPPRHVIGGGLVAWQCTYAEHAPIVIDDLRSGARTLPPGLAGLWAAEVGTADGASFTLTGVGRHWLYLIRRGYHYTDDILVGVRTAQIIPRPANRADRTVAPDSVGGTRALCAGIRRRAGVSDVGEQSFLPLLYDAPYGVSTTESPYTAVGRSGRLRACASAHAVPTHGAVVQLGGGLVTWSRAGRAYVQSVRTGRRTSRRAPGRLVAVTHTRNTLYAATRVAGGPAAARRYYRARIG